MYLNSKRKKYVKIDIETRSDDVALLDEVNSDLEDDIENLMNDSDSVFVLEESLENESDTDDEPLNLLVPEANCHVVENPTIKKTLDEQRWEKSIRKKQRKRAKQKEKTKEKEQGKKSNLVKHNLIGEKICSIYKGTM